MKKVIALLFAVAALGLVACGGDDDDETAATTPEPTAPAGGGGGGGGGGPALKLSAPSSGAFEFDKDQLSAKPGPVTIDFDNPAAISHDVSVEDSGGGEIGTSDLVAQGNTSLTVDLKAGKYTFFCTVPGHREGGMEGTLTVK